MIPTFEFVQVSPGEWQVTEGLPYRAWVRVTLRTDGRLACTELRLEADEITSRGLRQIPLGTVLDSLAMRPNARPAAIMWRTLADEDAKTPPFPRAAPRPRRSVITSQLLLEISREYLRLVKSGVHKPIKVLADKHKWSDGQIRGDANLRRLLRLARKRGVLGPSMHGKAGVRQMKRGGKKR